MRENQLPVHCTAAQETGRVQAAVDSDLERDTMLEKPRVSKLGTWLLASAVVSVTTLYSICNPACVPSCVAQTVKISMSADIKKRASTPPGGTTITDTAKAGAGTVAGAAGIDRNETGTRENSRRHSFNQGLKSPATEMPKAAKAKTSKSKKGFMVPPPPPTPCVLPPAFSFFPVQPAQQHAAHQQQLEEAQASPETHDQSAAREQQATAASARTEGTHAAALAADQELQAADQELQAAVRSSLGTVGQWTR